MKNLTFNSKRVVTMGEIMLRLSTPANTRFVQANQFVLFLVEEKLTLLYHVQTMVLMLASYLSYQITKLVKQL